MINFNIILNKLNALYRKGYPYGTIRFLEFLFDPVGYGTLDFRQPCKCLGSYRP